MSIQHLLNPYFVPPTVLRVLCALFHVSTYFTDKKFGGCIL